jgi:mercuric ion transport protein
MFLSRIFDKAGSVGVLASTFGCVGCFPAIASLSSALGIGGLSGYEVVAITILMPIFAALALAANAFNWFKHRRHMRGIISVIGPSVALSMLFPKWLYIWNTNLFYAALLLMLAVSIFDIAKPAKAASCST